MTSIFVLFYIKSRNDSIRVQIQCLLFGMNFIGECSRRLDISIMGKKLKNLSISISFCKIYFCAGKARKVRAEV
jgi:hypothetical protein